MPEKKDIFADIDELLREFGLESSLGSAALKETAEIVAPSHDDGDKYGIRAAKIEHFATGLFPHLPKVA